MILLASVLAPHSLPLYLALVFTLTGLFLLVASKTTRGGWRWRKAKRTNLAHRKLVLLVQQLPFVEIAEHRARRLLGQVGGTLQARPLGL